MHTFTVLLTGASSGIGKSIANTLADAGHRVFAVMRDIGGRNRENVTELSGVPGRSLEVVEADVSSDSAVEACVRHVLQRAGRIDVLINCAGIMWTGVTEAFTVAQFETLLQTNLLGPFRFFKAVLPQMRERRDGLLITITSTAGRATPPGFALYGASKAGLETLSEALGYEVSGMGIDSVIIEPGPFATNLMKNQQPPADSDVVKAYGQLGRFPERINEVVWPMLQKEGISIDPQLVADAVLKLIAAPKGKRPIRMTVGMDLGVAEMNTAAAKYVHNFLELLGFAQYERAREEVAAPGGSVS